MPPLGNAWHIPAAPEPRGRGGMRDPIGPVVPGTRVTVVVGNQFQGGGDAGNLLQVDSAALVRAAGAAAWTEVPVEFLREEGNNKFFGARITEDTFAVGDTVEYYLRVAYDDHDTTFVHAAGDFSATTADEQVAQATPFSYPVGSPAEVGCWHPVVELPNAAIHTHVLPTGTVLFWGRRDRPDQGLDEHSCTPQLWDPDTDERVATAQPRDLDGDPVNLFCAGHAFLPDGRLLVVGGHWADGVGLDQACVFDPWQRTWTPTARMTGGRWYPTATTLADGRVLVTSGADGVNGNNRTPQIWSGGIWSTAARLPGDQAFELYPRMHPVSTGAVFMSGPLATSWSFDPVGGAWAPVDDRDAARRDYAPAVGFARDRVVFVGGGNDAGPGGEPTAEVEVIDLAAVAPAWSDAAALGRPRRQHNAVLLPDGTVLVTGGTRGGGPPGSELAFNNLDAGRPVHTAELWDPVADRWTDLAAEEVDRCYHATTVLLPDGRVLSAGGGEFVVGGAPNDPLDTHRDAQVFSPPYLFRGPRPVIDAAPAAVGYGETFTVETPDAGAVTRVTWLRLASVTHSLDMSQRIDELAFTAVAGTVRVTAPASSRICPPGYHMLFLLTADGVPSRAAIIRVTGPVVPPAPQAMAPRAARIAAIAPPPPIGRRVLIGITSTCPYGLGACWGGAEEALRRLDGVAAVDPVPDAERGTAVVHLVDQRLPDPDRWAEQFARSVNGSYALHGVEVELTGRVEWHGGRLAVTATGARPAVGLVALPADGKVQRDPVSRAPEPLDEREAGAFAAVADAVGAGAVELAGPLRRTGAGFELAVRRVGSRTG